ncbi:MAG: NAD(P)H oxidoreductase [Rhizobiaceae bacterium]|nr:NAD(P)H oxidoreductase [Rhizobiaceae bacterium]
MKTLLVVAHPRQESLTGALGRTFAETLRSRGHEVEWADLYAEKFDPVLGPDDEPDWDDADKVYSPAVLAEMRRIERNEATVMIFPVYWWSTPALLKGWIDRVWNNGWAYGARKFPQRRVWMIALAGGDRALFEKRGYDRAMATGLDIGILDYCGVAEHRLEILYGALEGEASVAAILREGRRLADEF